MKSQIWVHKAGSFKAAEDFDIAYYRAMSPQERLAIIQQLREQHHQWGKGTRHGQRREGLRRVLRVIQQA